MTKNSVAYMMKLHDLLCTANTAPVIKDQDDMSIHNKTIRNELAELLLKERLTTREFDFALSMDEDPESLLGLSVTKFLNNLRTLVGPRIVMEHGEPVLHTEPPHPNVLHTYFHLTINSVLNDLYKAHKRQNSSAVNWLNKRQLADGVMELLEQALPGALLAPALDELLKQASPLVVNDLLSQLQAGRFPCPLDGHELELLTECTLRRHKENHTIQNPIGSHYIPAAEEIPEDEHCNAIVSFLDNEARRCAFERSMEQLTKTNPQKTLLLLFAMTGFKPKRMAAVLPGLSPKQALRWIVPRLTEQYRFLPAQGPWVDALMAGLGDSWTIQLNAKYISDCVTTCRSQLEKLHMTNCA